MDGGHMRSPAAEEELGRAAMMHNAQQQHRRKGIGTRVWLVVSESGQCRTEEIGKHSIMRWTGLPARDLRVLDPMLSYPSTILGRERAIVLNLEHIKAIITAKEVLMINSTNPLVVQFVHDLLDRIHDSSAPPPSPTHKTEEALVLLNSSVETHEDVNASSDTAHNGNNSSSRSLREAPVAPSPKLLPFEFRALEVCLESACRCLECETQTLEDEAYPALDELTSRVSTLNLERVRQIKSRLVAISGRVQKVRDELEHLLDDDNDMAEMYLTEKLDLPAEQVSLGGESDDEDQGEGDERAEDSNLEHSSEIFSGFKPNVEELEMLLEAYFAQIDGIQQKLGNMREYVDDTEDYINIMLDDKQNQLLQMGVMLSTSSMILNAGIAVVGLFGMNITNELFSAPTYKFWETSIGTVAGCVGLYLIAIAWGKSRNLI